LFGRAVDRGLGRVRVRVEGDEHLACRKVKRLEWEY
jgi:hypothetical protein